MHPETYLPLHHVRARDLAEVAATRPAARRAPHRTSAAAVRPAPLASVAARLRRAADELLQPECCPA
ncbi:hypothetical protein [Cellulomonas carbonis]|uniref:Uncharacterized protein n=1 Tax=Cellulomonas carbonis T26 TaxID=947969 RepID=A0A0A0BM54_9CELL|nr:hypothetical protein [Cellulomonas carbonis]KGM09598.1 hypothetical protein N868_01400 [Cellulomonas carbonis T26]GGC07361.1 hypothetical protein GCM10010972_20870 [Cellulomonas carbonis]